MKTFVDRLIETIQAKKTILCGGLDPQVRFIPESVLFQGWHEARDRDSFEPIARAIVIFNKAIIEAIKPYVAVVKPQMAFYEAYGHWGVWAFERTVKFAKDEGLLVIEDAKRCDGGDTAEAYAAGHLGMVRIWEPVGDRGTFQVKSFDVDAMTVVPYIGTSCITPFVKTARSQGKGIFIVDKTSFKPNSEVEQIKAASGLKVWEEVARLVKEWSGDCEGESGVNNVGVVVGATYPEEADRMRELLSGCFFLKPGYGKQGGGADGAVRGATEDGFGIIVNSSRAITFAYQEEQFRSDPKEFAEAARKAAEFARDDLNAALERAGKIPW